jgi:undecaprenyl-diphosphatase
MNPIAASIIRTGLRELPLLILLCILAGGIWIFAELADEVQEGELRHIDTTILLALRSPADHADPLGPVWVEEMTRDITALGSFTVVAFITLAAAGFLALQRKRHAAAFVLVAVGSGAALSMLLKAGFDRPRPDLVPHATNVYSSSFPSGHSMTAAVAYLTLAAVLIRVQSRRRLQAYVLGLAILLTVAVGVSRVYLGVHWPSDVLAGWAAGAAWAVLCWGVALWMQRKGDVEKGPEEIGNDRTQ